MLRLVAIMRCFRVVVLRLDQGVQNVDGVILVAADAAIQDFLLAVFRVEVPASATVLHNRDGQWPVLRTHVKRRGAVWFEDDAMHLVVALHELGTHVVIGNIIAGVENIARIRSKDRRECLLVV